jgi:hypothetical protein
MNDSISIAEELSPKLTALREARQRAAEARANAERLLREAEATEAELASQEEEAVIAAIVQHEQEALDALARLQTQLQEATSKKAQAEAAVAAIRASLAEHEERLRAAEIYERELLSDLSIAERRAHEALRMREHAELTEPVPAAEVPAPPPAAPPAAPIEAPPAAPPALDSIKAQRAAERRMADALRAGS